MGKPMQVPMISKVQKTVEVPQVEFVDNHVHVPVHKHRHVPMVSVVQKQVEVPVIETVEKVVDVPVVKQMEVPQVHTIENIVEVPLVQTVEKVVEVPMVGETIQGRQQTMNVPLAPTRQVAEVETVTLTEVGPPLPMEQHPEAIFKSIAPRAPSANMPLVIAMPQMMTTAVEQA